MIKKVFLAVVIAWLVYQAISYFSPYELQPDELRGKNILLTGASSGIGEEMAYFYAKMGANVFITARREQMLAKVVDQCGKVAPPGGKFGYLPADMGQENDRRQLVARALDFFGGDLDQVILNHAMIPDPSIFDPKSDVMGAVRGILEVNVVANVHLVALTHDALLARNGSLGVVSSALGRLAFGFVKEYSSSKFALDGYFSGLRAEFQNRKIPISVTLCFIGLIGTDSGKNAFHSVHKIYKDPSETISNFLVMASVEDAAAAIISATTLRQSELFHPPSQPFRLLIYMRHLFPSLYEMCL